MDFHPVSSRIEELLKERGLWYERFEHEPVRTSEEAARVRPEYSIRQGTKALIVRGKKGGKKTLFMVVVPGHSSFDRGKVQEATGCRDIRFVSEDEVRKITRGIEPGGVPPFGALFDLPTYVDEHVFDNERIIFSAGDRRVSIAMRSSEYHALLPVVVTDLARSAEGERCISPLAP